MKKRYTKRQILESIKYWEKMLEEDIESPTEKIIQALAVGKLNDEAFGSVGIYNDNGIFWDMPNSQSNKFVIIVSNIDRFNDRYICDVMGGPDNKQFQDFGTQDFSIENMPAQYDFDDIVHNASSKYGVKLGSMNGFRNALDAHNNIASSYEIVENKMKKRYTRKQIQESIAYWQKQLKLGNYKKLNESVASLTPHELELAEGYFVELFNEYGDLPKKIQIEAVKYKNDPSIGDGDEYESMLEKYGPVNWFWLADEFSEFADSGRYISEYASAFSKLAKAGYMSIDKNGFVTFDTNRIIGDEDATIIFK